MKTYRNILIVRTDRIGDVILTTPAIRAIREANMNARVSILVAPSTREIVDENPNLDEVITDDRKGVHRGFWGFMKLVLTLRRKRFDLAVIFHTKKRTNSLCFLAGIPNRAGYRNNKFGFLLTKKIKDTRPQGTKHEAVYCLDVLRALEMKTPNSFSLFMPQRRENDEWVKTLLRENDIVDSETLVAIHPGASCISKRWAAAKFEEFIEILCEKFSLRVILVGGPETKTISDSIHPPLANTILNLTGETTVSQLASVLKRCRLLVSNDSGPVHVAVAVGTPVISIFGRNQAGLSPVRWRPLGASDVVLHKEVGCKICLAHNCDIEFKCLEAISPQEVLEAAKPFLAACRRAN